MKRAGRYYFVVSLMFIGLTMFSQDYSFFQSYYFKPFIINPAITGLQLYPVVDISARKQWVGIENAPATFQLSGDYRIGQYDFYDPKGLLNKGPLKITDRIGIGAAFYRDTEGPSNQTGGLLSYAYHITINSQASFSFGLAITATSYSFNSSLLEPGLLNDPYLLSGYDSRFRVNFNIGGYWYTDQYFIGLSMDKILPDIYQVIDAPGFQPRIFAMGGYKFMHHSSDFNVEPSIIVKKAIYKDLAADINLKLYIKRFNWLAISYTTHGNVGFQFGLRLYKMIYTGYHYEYTIGDIGRVSFGSHEIHLGMNLGLTWVKEDQENISYLQIY